MKRRIALGLLLALLLCGACGCGGESPFPETADDLAGESAPVQPPEEPAGPEEETEPLPETPAPEVPAAGELPQLVAHAGGAIYGYKLTNSLEAIDQAYENGFRYLELDFSYTSDGSLVLLHDWESMAARLLFSPGVRTREAFLGAETFADLTLLDLDMLLAWLREHPDCLVITDTKGDNDPFLRDLFQQAGDLAQRFIPQVYSYEEYQAVRDLGFRQVILTLYRMEPVDPGEVIDFARRARPWAVTIPQHVLTPELVRGLADQGIPSYTHGVNDLSFFEQWQEEGLQGIYTDHFIPNKWVC